MENNNPHIHIDDKTKLPIGDYHDITFYHHNIEERKVHNQTIYFKCTQILNKMGKRSIFDLLKETTLLQKHIQKN